MMSEIFVVSDIKFQQKIIEKRDCASPQNYGKINPIVFKEGEKRDRVGSIS
jgi:hypothetical protein